MCVVALAHDDDEMAAGRRGCRSWSTRCTWFASTRARNLLTGGLRLATDRPLTHVLLDSPKMRTVLEQVRRDVATGCRAGVLFRDGALCHGAAAR